MNAVEAACQEALDLMEFRWFYDPPRPSRGQRDLTQWIAKWQAKYPKLSRAVASLTVRAEKAWPHSSSAIAFLGPDRLRHLGSQSFLHHSLQYLAKAVLIPPTTATLSTRLCSV